jgi:outer membrane receptor protein involved in Fe transport
MVERVEVVTGGASAQWGSDAVAGVVNIILKNHFKGLELRAQAGTSTYGDAGNYRVAALGGIEFGEGGHIVAGVDYVKNNEVGDIYSRPWGQRIWPRRQRSLRHQRTAGQHHRQQCSRGLLARGLITGPAGFALRNYEFTSATTVAPFDGGGIRNASLQVGGQGKSLAQGVSLAPSVERFNPYLHAEYEFSDALTVMAEASYSQTTAHLTALPPRDSAVTILASNPFIPDVVRTAMGALPSFTISRLDYDIGLFKVNVTNKTPRLMAGASGKLGGGWSWDAHVTWAQNDYRQTVPNNRNLTKFRFATDAVLSGGQIVCRATVPGASFNAPPPRAAYRSIFSAPDHPRQPRSTTFSIRR